jgi:hypothetical protein
MPSYVTPDSHDQLVYTLDESGSPWANTGVAGSLDATARSAGPVATAGVFNNGVALPGPYNTQEFLTTGDTSLGETTTSLSVSGWVWLTDYQSGQFGTFFQKEYALQASTWLNPAVMIGYTNNNQGLIRYGITIAATFYSFTVNSAGAIDIPTTGWHHVALVWDGYRIYIYFDGLQVDVRIPIATAGTYAIDFGAHGPWTFGGDDSNAATLSGKLDDIRVSDNVRDASYFEAMAYPNPQAEVEGVGFTEAFQPDTLGTLDIVPGSSSAASVGGTVNFPTNYRKLNHGLET